MQTHAKAALDAVADLAARVTLCELLVALHQLQSGLPIEPAHQRVDITVAGGHAHPITISTVFPVFLWRGHTLAHGPTLFAQAHALAHVQRQGILQKDKSGDNSQLALKNWFKACKARTSPAPVSSTVGQEGPSGHCAMRSTRTFVSRSASSAMAVDCRGLRACT